MQIARATKSYHCKQATGAALLVKLYVVWTIIRTRQVRTQFNADVRHIPLRRWKTNQLGGPHSRAQEDDGEAEVEAEEWSNKSSTLMPMIWMHYISCHSGLCITMNTSKCCSSVGISIATMWSYHQHPIASSTIMRHCGPSHATENLHHPGEHPPKALINFVLSSLRGEPGHKLP